MSQELSKLEFELAFNRTVMRFLLVIAVLLIASLAISLMMMNDLNKSQGLPNMHTAETNPDRDDRVLMAAEHKKSPGLDSRTFEMVTNNQR